MTHARNRSNPRLSVLVVLTLIVALVALAQRTVWAPLPQQYDDFIGGVAVGLAVAVLIGRLMSR